MKPEILMCEKDGKSCGETYRRDVWQRCVEGIYIKRYTKAEAENAELDAEEAKRQEVTELDTSGMHETESDSV